MESLINFETPTIDMAKIQQAANDAASKAIIDEVTSYYTGYSSPFRKKIREYIENNAPSVNFQLPNFAEALENSVKKEIESIANAAGIRQTCKAIREGFVHLKHEDDGTVLLSTIFEEFAYYLDDNSGSQIDLTIREGNGYFSNDKYGKLTVHNVNSIGDEKDFQFDIWFNKQDDGLYKIISMPYASKEEDGVYRTKLKIKTKDGLTVEMPSYSGISDNHILLVIAKCIMFNIKIKIDKTYFEHYVSEDD